MVPDVPLNSPVWQIYASAMKRLLTALSSVQCRISPVRVVRYRAYTHLLGSSPPGLRTQAAPPAAAQRWRIYEVTKAEMHMLSATPGHRGEAEAERAGREYEVADERGEREERAP